MAMKHLITLGSALALAFSAAPIAAQDAADDAMESIFDDLEVVPLSPEQEARMPLAREVAALVAPDGALASTIGGFFSEEFIGAFETEQDSANDALTEVFGYYFEFELEQAAAEEALAIIEPNWQERRAAELAATEQMMALFTSALEPSMREAMAEMYAIYFTETQLREIAAFYGTPAGEVFARANYEMSGDPQFYARMFGNETLSEAFEELGGLEEFEAVPVETRAFADLSSEERRRLAVLTGLTEAEIEESMTFEWQDEMWNEEGPATGGTVGSRLYTAEELAEIAGDSKEAE